MKIDTYTRSQRLGPGITGTTKAQGKICVAIAESSFKTCFSFTEPDPILTVSTLERVESTILPSHYALPFYDFDLHASHARTLLPAALASVPFGFVLVRVRFVLRRFEREQCFAFITFRSVSLEQT